MVNGIYQRIDVWLRVKDNLALRYQCLFRFDDEKYAVQSVDSIHKDSADGLDFSEKNFVELFLDESPDIRCDWFSSIGEAIEDFEKQFS